MVNAPKKIDKGQRTESDKGQLFKRGWYLIRA